tara:strand:- start:41537 stop:42238 length:702 start_codon:yes stop_codon:yes gene_type:complete
MMKPFMITFTIGIFLIQSLKAEEVSLVTFKIPLFIKSKTEGKFIELSNEVAKRAGLKFNFEIYPPKLTMYQYNHKKAQCFFPVVSEYIPNSTPRSKTIFEKKNFVFTRDKAQKLSIRDLEGKRVGLTLGYGYSDQLTSNKKIEFEYTNTDTNNVKKLINKRIDYFVIEERSGLKAISKHGKGKVFYHKDFPLTRQKVFYSCHNKAHIEKINKAIESMIEDGTLNQFFPGQVIN